MGLPPRKRDVLLYDGACALCRRSAAALLRRLPREGVEAISFRAPGALERFPGVEPEACERALQVVRADGRVFSGAEAVVQVFRGGPAGWLLRAYYLPGVRQAADAAYAAVARRRFRLRERPGASHCP